MSLTLERLTQLRDAYAEGARSLSAQIDRATKDRLATLGAVDALTKLIEQEGATSNALPVAAAAPKATDSA